MLLKAFFTAPPQSAWLGRRNGRYRILRSCQPRTAVVRRQRDRRQQGVTGRIPADVAVLKVDRRFTQFDPVLERQRYARPPSSPSRCLRCRSDAIESVGLTGIASRIGSSRFFVSAFLIRSSWN